MVRGGVGVNARAVNALAGVIHAAMQTRQTAAGIAAAVDAAGLLMSPETAREFEQAKTDARRRGIAWRRAYQRAMNRGWAADRAGARSRELQTAVQESLGALLGMQMQRDAARGRVAELEQQLAQAGDHGAQAYQRAGLNGAEAAQLRTRVAELEQQLSAPRELFLAEYEADDPQLYLTLDAARDALTELRNSGDPRVSWDWFEQDGVHSQWRTDPDTDRPVSLLLGSVLPLALPAGLLAAEGGEPR